MATSIVSKLHAYVLENDRTLEEKDQTVFHIMPKTVRGAVDTAVSMSRVQTENRRKGTKEIDAKKMNLAEDQEWERAVHKIENFVILPSCPGPTTGISGYNHFALKSVDEPAKYAKDDDGRIRVVFTEDATDLLYIYCAMCVDDTEEILRVYFNYSELTAGSKNV